MCGGGSDSQTNTYQAPPGPGEGIAGVPIGSPNYQQAAQSLLSTGQSYGQMAALAAQNAPQQPTMAAPPAPQSAFNGGIGQYLAGMGSRPMGPSPAMAAVEAVERQYDPRTAATEMLQGYESGFEARPLSYYTPNAMANMDFQSTAAEKNSASPSRSGGSRTRYVSRPSGGGSGYMSIGDMLDGGGPGASGSEFGGVLGGLSNRTGLSPRASSFAPRTSVRPPSRP